MGRRKKTDTAAAAEKKTAAKKTRTRSKAVQITETQQFNHELIRTLWDDKNQKWWYCIKDVVKALADTGDAKDYTKKMRKRDRALSRQWNELTMLRSCQTPGGVQRLNFATTEGVLRIIMTIPSLKAEPLKAWMAQTAKETLEARMLEGKKEDAQLFVKLTELIEEHNAEKNR